MNKFILSIGFTLALAVSALADSVSVNFIGTVAGSGLPPRTNILNGPAKITSLQFYNSSTNTQTLYFFDAPATNNQLVVGTVYYTNTPTITVTNGLVTITKYTTNFGFTTATRTNTGTFLFSGFTTNSALSNYYRQVYSISLAANSSVTPSLGDGFIVGFGLSMTNLGNYNTTSNLLINAVYTPLR